jgi:hypothetical protein
MNRRSRAGIVVFALALLFSQSCVRRAPKADYPVKPVPFTDVHLTDSFWAPRLETNRTVTIPHIFKEEEDTGRVRNFDLAREAIAGETSLKFCTSYPFDDSDVYKTIEAASYAMAVRPDPGLDKFVDGLIAKIAAAQEKDGYLYTIRTIGGPPPVDWMGKERWSHLYMSHELYNLGHLFEAAVAHYEATGKKTLLDVALKSADLVCREFGPGKRTNPPGHEEIEIGLVKLYRATGRTKYLDMARFFIDARGKTEGRVPYRGNNGEPLLLYGEYSQDHKPFVEQDTAVGHAVRAGYLYAGAADVAALTGDRDYVVALDKIWDDVVGAKIYLTGGIGAAGAWEGYGPPYRLPNATAYAETCANIATFLWNSRMFRLEEDAKYVDVMERILYNGILSGLSLSGDRFFYSNPLASFGQHERVPWFGCACCPPNAARILASVPGYVYAADAGKVYVNLFAQGTAQIAAGGTRVEIAQSTEYPWKGNIRIDVRPAKPVAFALCVRIPGWSLGRPIPYDLYRYADESAGLAGGEKGQGGETVPAPVLKEIEMPMVKVDGQAVDLNLDKGYVVLRRTWQAGDTVEVSLPMPVRRVAANDKVEADRGRIAVERGPLVYCAEAVDNGGRVSNFVLPDGVPLAAAMRPDLLGGVVSITGEAEALSEKGGRITAEKKAVTLIPYYAWANRGKGEMEVWIAREPAKARVAAEPGLAARAIVTASEGAKGIKGVNDQYEPEASDDPVGYMHWWPKKGTTEWVEYAFPEPVRVSRTAVYWFDDTGGGECRVPASWRLLYKSGGKWLPVANARPYGVAKDAWNTVTFAPVRTTALRLEVEMQKEWSAGIHEWKLR